MMDAGGSELPPSFTARGQTFLERHGISPVLFGFVSLIVVFLLYQIVGGGITAAMFLFLGGDKNVTALRLVTMAGQLGFILLPAVVLTRLATFESRAFLRLRRPSLLQVLMPLAGIFSLQQMLQVYMAFQERIPLPKSIQPFFEEIRKLLEETYKMLISSSSIPELVFVVIVVALVPSFAEEIFFRGTIQRSFENGLGGGRGLFLTALIFAMYHLNPFSFIPLFVLGLYLGYLVHRSNSIWPAVAAHFYNNAIACVLVYMGFEDDYIATGKAELMSAPDLLATFAAFSLVFFLSTYYFMRVTPLLLPYKRRSD
jgi:membrane protease YdiL (CAAX protease family)